MSIPDLRSLRREQARPRWFRWLRGLAIAAAALFVLYVAVGFWVLPGVVKTQLQTRGEALLGRKVEVDRVAFNPFRVALTLEGFRIREPDGSNFVAWKRLAVDFEFSSFLRREWRLRQFLLEELQGKVVINNRGVANFADIQSRLAARPASPSAEPATKSEPWPLAIEELALDIKPIAFSDYSRPTAFVTALGPVNLRLKDVHTGLGRETTGGVTGRTEAGEEFSWRGVVVLQPLSSRGHLDLRDFSLPKHAAFLHGLVPFAPLSGKVSASVDYEVTSAGGHWNAAVRAGEATVEQLALATAGSVQPLVKWDRIALRGLEGGTEARRFRVQSLDLSGGLVDLARDGRGINLAAWAPTPSPGGAAAASPAAPSAPFAFQLDSLGVSGLAVQWLDTTTPVPVRARIAPISLSIKNLDTSKLSGELPISFSAGFGGDSRLAVDGVVTAQPFLARLRLEGAALPLAPFSPYLEASLPFQLTEGSLGFTSEVNLAQAADRPFAFGARAEVAVDQLSLQRQESGARLVRWNRLQVKGIEATSEPSLRVVVGSVSFEQPEVDVSLAADRTLNWSLPSAPAVSSPAVSPSAASPLSLAVDRVELQGGRITFQDSSLQPSVRLSLADLKGRIGGLSSSNLARADVDLSGRFDGGAPFSVKGQVNPLSDEAFTDVAVGFQGLDLLPASPYSGKYVGRKLARGNASLDMKVKLSRRTLAVAQTLVLDQLALGSAVESKDATKLPVGLALALLRDTRGRITLNVPVEGSLDDPQFRIGAVVWGVVRNILEKAATAPFALLGSMFGGGGDELSWVEFAAGSAHLHEKGSGKMDTVGRALRERPALSLDIAGHFQPDVDAVELRVVLLQKRLKQLRWEELRRTTSEGALPPPDRIELAAEDEARFLTQLYSAQLAAAPKTSATSESPATTAPASAVAPSASTPVPEEKPGLLRRLVRFLAGDTPASSSPAPANSKRPAAAVAAAKAPSAPQGAPIAPVLPSVDEMRTALLNQVEVSDEQLAALGDQRAQAIRAHLVEQGQVSPERIFLVPSSPGSTRADLTLK